MLFSFSFFSILEVLLVIVPALLSVAYVTVAERKTMASMQRRVGPNKVGVYGLLQAFVDALKLILKEYVSPTQANLILFFLGPIMTLIFSLLGYAVIPYGPGLAVSDYHLGILYMLAVSSLSTYGILLAGWSANSKYAFLGSLRSTAQLISYELILSSAILLIIFFTGSLNLTDVVESQKSIWFVIPLLPVFIIFFIGALAETNRAPMDLAEAEDLGIDFLYGLQRQIVQKLSILPQFIKDSASLKITICLEGLTPLGTLKDESEKSVSFKCNSPICYALSAGNQRYGISHWIGPSETERDHLISYFDPAELILLVTGRFKVRYGIVQNLIYHLLFCLINLRHFFRKLLGAKFLLTLVLFMLIIFKYPVLLNNWDSVCVCSIVPVKVFNDLDKLESIKSFRSSLKGKSGIYGVYNTANKKQYIGSARDLYTRLLEHIVGNKSNKALQRAIKIYGLNKFRFVIYERHPEGDRANTGTQLTDLETQYIGKFKFSMLYNFKKTATSMLGYKHTEEALLKMVERYKNKENHPFFVP